MNSKIHGPVILSVEETTSNPYTLVCTRRGVRVHLVPPEMRIVRTKQLDWLMVRHHLMAAIQINEVPP